jgi:hypothetical protein
MQNECDLRNEQFEKIDDAERADQIFRIDTAALLKVIRELETKLSDHHRQVNFFVYRIFLSTPLNCYRWLWLVVRIKYLHGPKR